MLDTTLAFQVFRELSLPADHPQVVAGLNYLRKTYDADAGIWPIRPDASPQTPGAPWWKAKNLAELIERFDGCALNPRAEVLGYLIDYAPDVDRPWVDRVCNDVRETLEQKTDPLDMHALLCVARLTRTEKLDTTWRRALIERVRADTAAQVNPDASSWDGYALKPWWVAERTDDPMLGALPPGLAEAMWDHETQRQEEDGGWPPCWNWGDAHADLWPAARLAWKSILTGQMLRVSRAG